MRGFKFRARDKENKVMVNVDMLGEAVLHIQGAEWENREDFIVMQSTGLFDKNGVEIYEGDIVRYGVSYERINKIIYEQGCFQLQGNGGLAPLRYHHLLDSNTPDVEVIGNVHDNPELLQKETAK